MHELALYFIWILICLALLVVVGGLIEIVSNRRQR